MFEKESKEYANKWLEHVKDLELQHKTDEKPEYIRIEEAHQKGAELGYNKAKEDAGKMKSQFLELCNLKDMRIAELEKANEWHYPSNGEYPKEYEDIWICFLTEDDMKDCIRGWYEYDLDEDEHYFKTVNTFGTEIIKKPYAWKEIVLPKESE